jgi:hypothetical protein
MRFYVTTSGRIAGCSKGGRQAVTRQIAGQLDLAAALFDDDMGICVNRLDGTGDAAGAASAIHVEDVKTHETFLGSSHA